MPPDGGGGEDPNKTPQDLDKILKMMHSRGNFFYIPPEPAFSPGPAGDITVPPASAEDITAGHLGVAFPPVPLLPAELPAGQAQDGQDVSTHGEAQEQRAQTLFQDDANEFPGVGDLLASDRIR